ncbi:Mdm33 family-domain-containing protein [Mycena belliarum]|uniref:Sensitive to high expression protein 9, mitochondrial n=1 Tax=Mycena belliarum TaxID=1033014 RepID=A0AAD6TV61_9AGAR|nr:Mdm33 family-domain-containing protein [Mycena belliae]
MLQRLPLTLRSSRYRPLVTRHISGSTVRHVARTLPPEKEPEDQQPLAESSSNSPETSSTWPPDPAEPVASSSMQPSDLKDRLRKWTGHTAITVRSRADEFTATTKSTLSQLGFQLNRMTGYEEIEALKRRVVEQESRITEARNAARRSKTAYDAAVAQRSNSQREINDLLQRKSNWNQADIARFTKLVPQDHSFEQEEARARAAVHDAEEAVEHEFSELMRTILARYHEEQVWSDKIRSASTYGSLAALGLNLLVFVVAIVFVEPWKRRRLAMTFEKKIEEMGLENKAVVEESMRAIGRQLEAQAQLLVSSPLPAAIEPVSGKAPAPRRVAAASLPGRIWEKSQDPEIGATIAGAAAVASALGWLVKAWLAG